MGAQRLARRWGGTVRTARVPLAAGAQEAAAAVAAEFSDRTALVVVDHATSPTSRFLPVDLISAAGPHANVLKVRPPLVFSKPNVDLFVGALEDALGEVAPR